MSVIHITTELVKPNKYEFIQTWEIGEQNLDERIFQENHEDRMFAAMTNLGYACKWYADKNHSRGDICIITDTDGKDQRYNGEHDDLFKAIRSRHDYQENRIKYSLIYGKYAKYLDRIRELADTYEIGFTQNELVTERTEKNEKENLDTDNPYLIQNQKWTRDNIIKISMRGTHNMVGCNACHKSIQYQQSDNFTPVRLQDAKGRKVLIRSNKQLVKNFQEIHLGMHLNGVTHNAKPKT